MRKMTITEISTHRGRHGRFDAHAPSYVGQYDKQWDALAAARKAAEDRGDTPAADLAEAQSLAPWAAEIVKVAGGWIAFEDSQEAETWRAQQ